MVVVVRVVRVREGIKREKRERSRCYARWCSLGMQKRTKRSNHRRREGWQMDGQVWFIRQTVSFY